MLLVNPGSYFSLLISTNAEGPVCSGKVATFYPLNSNKYHEWELWTLHSHLSLAWSQANQNWFHWIFPDTASETNQLYKNPYWCPCLFSHNHFCTKFSLVEPASAKNQELMPNKTSISVGFQLHVTKSQSLQWQYSEPNHVLFDVGSKIKNILKQHQQDFKNEYLKRFYFGGHFSLKIFIKASNILNLWYQCNFQIYEKKSAILMDEFIFILTQF